MRIGIDCRIFSSRFTGIGRYTYELVQHFIALNDELNRKHEIVLFFNEPEYKEFHPPNLAVKKILVNAPHYSLKEQTTFLHKLKKEKLDIVHFPHFNVPLFYRKPYIVTIHDLTLSFFPGRKMTKWYHRLAYNLTIKNAVRTAKKIIAVSENTKRDIIENLNIAPQKIHTIYNGLSEIFRIKEPAKTAHTLKKYHIKSPFLLYTGVHRDHKNLPRLIEALHILLTEKKLDLHLVMTGKSDPHYPEVQNTIEKFQLEDRVIFTNLVEEDELVDLYNAAATYVFPSLYEGFGFPPLESMRCGTPVAASNSSSIPEICGDENAVYFDPYSAKEIADKIEILFKSPQLQAELIEKGIHHSAKFSWEKSARKTFDLLTHV